MFLPSGHKFKSLTESDHAWESPIIITGCIAKYVSLSVLRTLNIVFQSSPMLLQVLELSTLSSFQLFSPVVFMIVCSDIGSKMVPLKINARLSLLLVFCRFGCNFWEPFFKIYHTAFPAPESLQSLGRRVCQFGFFILFICGERIFVLAVRYTNWMLFKVWWNIFRTYWYCIPRWLVVTWNFSWLA